MGAAAWSLVMRSRSRPLCFPCGCSPAGPRSLPPPERPGDAPGDRGRRDSLARLRALPAPARRPWPSIPRACARAYRWQNRSAGGLPGAEGAKGANPPSSFLYPPLSLLTVRRLIRTRTVRGAGGAWENGRAISTFGTFGTRPGHAELCPSRRHSSMARSLSDRGTLWSP